MAQNIDCSKWRLAVACKLLTALPQLDAYLPILIEYSNRNLMEINAVAFDLDGLMFNTEDLYDEVLDEILVPYGHRFSLPLKLKMMGLPGPQAAAVLIAECQLVADPDQLLDEAHERLAGKLPDRLKTMPGLLTLLELIERVELPKSIATSSSPHFAAEALRISGLSDRFKFVLTAKDVENGKPFPDIYLESARRHEVAAANMLVLEDSLVGSQAAAAAETISVAIPGSHSREQDFSHTKFRFERLDAAPLLKMVKARRSDVLM